MDGDPSHVASSSPQPRDREPHGRGICHAALRCDRGLSRPALEEGDVAPASRKGPFSRRRRVRLLCADARGTATRNRRRIQTDLTWQPIAPQRRRVPLPACRRSKEGLRALGVSTRGTGLVQPICRPSFLRSPVPKRLFPRQSHQARHGRMLRPWKHRRSKRDCRRHCNTWSRNTRNSFCGEPTSEP